MNYNDSLDFEIIIDCILENSNIKTGKSLKDFGIEIHKLLEIRIQLYADYNNIDDYDPCY
jgi:hypothetical protein